MTKSKAFDIFCGQANVQSLRFFSNQKVFIQVHNSTAKSGFSVMFSGAFTFFEFGPLIVVEGKINKHTYLQFVKDFIILELKASPHDLIFMQDNARPHVAQIVKDN